MFDKLQQSIKRKKHALKNARFTAITVAVFIIFSGCGVSTSEINTAVTLPPDETELIYASPEEPMTEYERPVVKTSIETDQLGYVIGQKKVAIFRGEALGSEFRILRADTGETVYTGEIKTKSVQGTDYTYNYGDFTGFNESGDYYVQTDVIGYSYKFTISENPYNGMLEDALKQFYYNRCGYSLTGEYAGENARSACHMNNVSLQSDAGTAIDVTGGWHLDTAGNRSVIRGCSTIETLLMAYEYNTVMFDDACGIPESGDGIPDILNEIHVETEWLLKMQEPSTGAVYKGVAVVDNGQGTENPSHIEPPDMSSTLYFASAMAYFSYIYQVYDSSYATVCIQAADRAMKYADKFKDTADADEYFRAAAMMYRATGYINYRSIINQYMDNVRKLDMSDNVVFSGCVTYLATKQKTVKSYCDTMTAELKAYAVDISNSRGDSLYLMGEEVRKVEHSILLNEISRLTVVNYMVSSNEYEILMEKYLHFFMGCNPENICYAGQYGSINITDTQPALDIMKQPELNACFILLLSGIESGYLE